MSKVKCLLADNYLYQMVSSFLTTIQVVISANFKDSEKTPVLRESFIHAHRACRKILLSFKIPKGMSTPDDFASSTVEMSSSTSLGQEQAPEVFYKRRCS